MKHRCIAISLILAIAGGVLTGCSDEDESQVSGTRTENYTASEENGEAHTTAISGEKASGVGVRTTSDTSEPVTIEPESTEPAVHNPPKIDANVDVTELIGKTAAEVAYDLGDWYVETDTIPGYYVMYNYDVLPEVRFYFEDHTWDSKLNGTSLSGDDLEEVRRGVGSSTARITKINRYLGAQDDFTIGMSYMGCTKIIGDFPVSTGTDGETMAGMPLSVRYCYVHETNTDCVVELNFELTDELDRAINAGYLYYGNSSDISSNDIASFNPKLITISVIDAPHISMRDAEVSCSSKLPDISSGGKLYTYDPKNAFDGDLSTCWCENGEGVGIGESISVKSANIPEESYITIYGGLLSSQESFYKNCRPSEVRVSVDNSSGMEYYLPTYYTRKYRRAIPMMWTTDNYTFTIIDSDSSRAEYSDTCISEIVFNGR